MTGNQIAYWGQRVQEAANLEQARHNREQEKLNLYATRVQEAYNRGQLAIRQGEQYETARHNRESEALSAAATAAQNRLASAQLLLNSSIAAETARSNRAREDETNRSNLAKERENVRHNQASEAYQSANITIAQQEADYKGWQVALGVGKLLIDGVGLVLKQKKAGSLMN